MTTAKTREQYVKAWESHINQLAHLVLESSPDLGVASDRWNTIKGTLTKVLEQAADRQGFEDGQG